MMLSFILLIARTLIIIVYFRKNVSCIHTNFKSFSLKDLGVEKYFETRLDHFNPFDDRTFPLRYFQFTPGPPFNREDGRYPLYIELGGRERAVDYAVKKHVSFEWVKTYGSDLVLIEHRFYGESKPRSEQKERDQYGSPLYTRIDEAYLPYLSSEQYMHDIARFIVFYKKENPRVNMVVLLGCSDAADVAIKLRYRFHHLVDGIYVTNPTTLDPALPIRKYVEKPYGIYNKYDDRLCETSLLEMGPCNANTSCNNQAVDEEMQRHRKLINWYCHPNSMDRESIADHVNNVINLPYDAYRYRRLLCSIIKNNPETSSRQAALYDYVGLFPCGKYPNQNYRMRDKTSEYLRMYQKCNEVMDLSTREVEFCEKHYRGLSGEKWTDARHKRLSRAAKIIYPPKSTIRYLTQIFVELSVFDGRYDETKLPDYPADNVDVDNDNIKYIVFSKSIAPCIYLSNSFRGYYKKQQDDFYLHYRWMEYVMKSNYYESVKIT